LFGLALGVTVTLSFVLAFRSTNDGATTIAATTPSGTTRGGAAGVAAGPGWHVVNVYHGGNNLEAATSGANGAAVTAQTAMLKQNYKAGSQVDQDKVIEILINRYRTTHGITTPPYFVDLAANDAIQLSNTIYLEEKGWRGLCIEPNPVYWYRLAAARRCAIAGAFVGGQRDGEKVEVSLTNEEYGGIVGKDMDNAPDARNPHDRARRKNPTEVRFTVSLTSAFNEFRVPRVIDYLSLDVEGAEELVMRDFPFGVYRFRVMTVERPKPELQRLLEGNGYVMVMKLVYWGETLWIHESFDISIDEVKRLVHSVTSFPKKMPDRNSMVWFKKGEYRRNRKGDYTPDS